MNRRLLMLILICLILLNCTSCAGKREVDELGIVVLTAVDWDEETDKYKITVQIVEPQKASGGFAEIKIWNASATGSTLMRASKNLRSVVSKNIVWFHSQLIIMSERIAKKGLNEVIDFFARNSEIRYNSWVLIIDKPIKDILKINPRFENSLAGEINSLIQNNQDDWSESYALNLKDLLIRLADKDFDEVTGRVTSYKPDLEPAATYDQLDLVKDLPESNRQVIALSGMSVLKNGRLVGWLDRRASRGYLWLTNEVQGGAIVEHMGSEGIKYSLEILSANSKLEPKVAGDNIKYNLEIKSSMGITEATGKFDLTKEEDIAELEQLVAHEIKKDIKLVLEIAQKEYNADIFGYGNALYRSNPQYWNKIKDNWNLIFPTVTTDIKVKVIIKKLGMISKSIVD